MANVLALGLLFAVGETLVRLRVRWKSPAEWLVADPALGYKLNPEVDGFSTLGIRHPEIPLDKPAGQTRWLFLGDSVAWDRDGFVSKVREHYREEGVDDLEVINAAIPGYTTFQERKLLERDLVELEPDLVVLQYCLNDNHRFLHELDGSGRWLFTREAKNAMLPGIGWLDELLRASFLLTELRVRLMLMTSDSAETFPWVSEPAFQRAWQDEAWRAMRGHLTAMRDLLRERDTRFLVVAVPYEPQLKPDLLELDEEYTLKPQRTLERICDDLEVPLLDLHPVFLQNQQADLFRDGIHLTEEGHRLVAEHLVAFLEKEGSAGGRVEIGGAQAR